jgi:hypothetical protein
VSKKWNILWIVLALLLLTGCSLQTLDSLYQVPKRSDEYKNLQAAIDSNLAGRDYCAPQAGENLQAVQTADLDGDGVKEYLLFTKATTEKPLHILIFRLQNGEYVLADTIQSHGFAFDEVEYARIDDRPGFELIVGCKISDQVARSVSVYSFHGAQAVSMMSANYTKFLTCDLNLDARSELMVLRPGESDEANGLAELYRYDAETMDRSTQINLSASADRLKRVVTGKLEGGQPAVFVASAMMDNSVVTDIFTVVKGEFVNISASSGPSEPPQTLRKYPVYEVDIDEDDILELPELVTMRQPHSPSASSMQHMIRWYSMTSTGEAVEKVYTFHDFLGGWYMTLDNRLAERIAVTKQGGAYNFYVWDEAYLSAEKVLTVFYMPGATREDLTEQEQRFAIYEGNDALYAAALEDVSESFGVNSETVIKSFHLIHQDWKTQEVSK